MLLLATLGNDGKHLLAQRDPMFARVNPASKAYRSVARGAKRPGRRKVAKWGFSEGRRGVQSPLKAALPRQEGPWSSLPALLPAAHGCGSSDGIFMNGERRLWSNKSQEKSQAKKGKGKREEKQRMVINVIQL